MIGPPTLRIGLLAIGRRRPGFDPQWGKEMEAAAWQACEGMFHCERPAQGVVDDGTLRQAITEFRQAGCDLLVVLQPTMGDGRLAPILAQLWDGPLVLWATPERPGADRVTACSLVGNHVFASMFRQLDRPFELVYGMPGDESVSRQLEQSVHLARAAASLRRAKVGLIGYHAPGFINIHADPIAVSRLLGAQLQHFGLAEFQERLESLDEDRVADDVREVLQLDLPKSDDLGQQDLVPNSRYYLALCDLLRDENLDALALRCWPELPNQLGHWAYLAMMRLSEEEKSVSLEGDVDGAILGLLGFWLDIGVGYVSDWLEHDEQTITLWHPGHAPRSFCVAETLQLGRHFNNDKPLVVNAQLLSGQPITLARLWRCDDRYHLTAFAACTEELPGRLLGACGRARVASSLPVPERFDRMCHAGMPHHVTLFQGDHVARLRRLADRLRFSWLELE